MQLRPPRSRAEKEEAVWEGIWFTVRLTLALIFACWLAHLFVVEVIRKPIVKARQATIEQKVAMMDEVYAAAVERNYKEAEWSNR